jgi:hypothetical protein
MPRLGDRPDTSLWSSYQRTASIWRLSDLDPVLLAAKQWHTIVVPRLLLPLKPRKHTVRNVNTTK